MIGEKDRWRLEHMREAISAIREHARANRDSALVVHAILYNIAVLGEAAGQLSDDARALAPEIPWRDIIGMRIIVAHQYFRVDHATVWQVVDRHLDPLSTAIERLLAP